MTVLVIFLSIAICCQIYFEKIIAKRVPIKRKKKIFKLLKNEFNGLKENNLGFFECNINNKKIVFEYITNRYRYNFSNKLYAYIDITDIENEINKLCKIHFNCSSINNRDWVKMEVMVLFNSLTNLAKHSKKTVDELISQTEFYISQKRVERTKISIISSQRLNFNQHH